MNQVKDRFRKELLESCVPFWLSHAVDTEYGGLLNCLDREGKVYSTDKSIWMQGRAAWMFSYLYNNIENNDEYLKLAKSCLDFLEKYGIDEDGRMFFTVTRDGKPTEPPCKGHTYKGPFHVMRMLAKCLPLMK